MGGGAIRTAAKVAGITAATGAFRGAPAEHYSLYSAARKAVSGRPVATAASDDVKLVASNSESGEQISCLEFDDWVLPVMEEQAAINSAEAMPRVVFDGLPIIHEAKQAVSDLSVALDKAYLSSPNSVGCGGSVVVDHDLNLPPSNELVEETKGCVTNEIIIGAPVLPAPAIMAFKFLHESSVAKDVVASIACDPNVWNAVLQNQELQKFMESQRACKNFSGETVVDYGSKRVNDYSSECAGSDHSYEDEEFKDGSGFRNFFQKLKRDVVDMLSSLTDYLKDLFGGKDADNRAEVIMERSFMGLAVMAILVILLKRA